MTTGDDMVRCEVLNLTDVSVDHIDVISIMFLCTLPQDQSHYFSSHRKRNIQERVY